ncbi:MAG: B12-binding domain-containing radical SAM protein [Methylococcaceae bacterium]|nr:B12-binding domain-containing radical SAM protein [Methylococcaceae bacterium]
MAARKIIFVNPPYERIAAGYQFVRHITNRSPSLGLLYLAAAVRDQGYQTAIIESDIEDLSPDQVAHRIVGEKPDYVGITLFTVAVWQAARIARMVKQACPWIRIIVGGPHVSSMSTETLERFPEFDIAVIHEGERVLPELLACFDRNETPEHVQGILWRRNGELLKTPPAPAINDLDNLPMPAWDLLHDFPGRYLPAIFDYPRGPVATLVASRGCPFSCKFCDTSTFGAKVRANSPEMVFKMMKFLNEKFAIRHIQFVDDLFLASRIRTMALCDLIINNGLDMTWNCTARVDTVKPDVLKRMKQAGCWEISFGLETGSNELLQKMDKAARVESSEKAVNWTHEAGIRCKGLFMLGYPGESSQTIQQTKTFVRRLPMTTMNLSKFTPYPGSPIYRELYGTNIRKDHWEKMNGMNFIWAPEGLSIKELDLEYQNILKAFYKQRRVMHKYLVLAIKDPTHLKRLFLFLMGFLNAKFRSYRAGRRGALVEPNQAGVSEM